MKKFITGMIIAVVGLILATHVVVAEERDRPDILGIQLGMTPEKVTSILEKDFPLSKIEKQQLTVSMLPDKPFISYLKVVHEGQTVVAEFPGPPNESRVIAVNRNVALKSEEATLLSTLIQSLTEKYGPYTRSQGVRASYTGGVTSWIKDKSGNLLKTLPNDSCESIMSTFGSNGGTPLLAPRNEYLPLLKEGCVSGIVVQYSYDYHGKGIVQGFNTVIANMESMYNAQTKTQEYFTNLTQESVKIEQEKASKVKPKL